MSFRSNMGRSGDNRRKINCQYEINMLDWCLFLFVVLSCMFYFYYYYFLSKDSETETSETNFKFKFQKLRNFRTENKLDFGSALFSQQGPIWCPDSNLRLLGQLNPTSFQRSMDSSFWIDLFVPREVTNKRKFTIYTLQCTHDSDNCNYNLTYVHRHFYCGTEAIHSVFDTRLPADFV